MVVPYERTAEIQSIVIYLQYLTLVNVYMFLSNYIS